LSLADRSKSYLKLGTATIRFAEDLSLPRTKQVNLFVDWGCANDNLDQACTQQLVCGEVPWSFKPQMFGTPCEAERACASAITPNLENCSPTSR
jgi:hypothetical protein